MHLPQSPSAALGFARRLCARWQLQNTKSFRANTQTYGEAMTACLGCIEDGNNAALGDRQSFTTSSFMSDISTQLAKSGPSTTKTTASDFHEYEKATRIHGWVLIRHHFKLLLFSRSPFFKQTPQSSHPVKSCHVIILFNLSQLNQTATKKLFK